MSRHTTEAARHRPKGRDREIDREIDLAGVGKTVLGVFLLTLAAMGAMWGMFEYLLGSAQESDPAPPAMSEAARPALPPEPRLQASPEGELERFRAAENARLNSYGWQDREAGVVRIPIGRAMEVLAAGHETTGEATDGAAMDAQAAGADEQAAEPAAAGDGEGR